MIVVVLGKRKRMSKLAERITQAIEVNEAANPIPREVQNNQHVDEGDQRNTEGLNEGNLLWPYPFPLLKN